MPMMPEPFQNAVAQERVASIDVDWSAHPTVVIESDDWGACEHVADPSQARDLQPALERLVGGEFALTTTLESPEDLGRLYEVLGSAVGCDGRPATLTAFMCLGNPDYEAIRAEDYRAYADIGIDEGVPGTWERGDLPAAWREGLAGGVFSPEFHAGLHHTSPSLWLERLRGDEPVSKAARLLFDHHAYIQSTHLPEYHRMPARAQAGWIDRAFQRFHRLFGFYPGAGVNSDAMPMTETLWAAAGLRTVCLKNARDHEGRKIVYPTKAWNAQNPDCPMGAYKRALDLTYLGRNVHMDGIAFRNQAQDADDLMRIIRACWARGEPAIINTHRANYVSLDPDRAERGRQLLGNLLQRLSKEPGLRFLTSDEVGQLYRQGYSERWIGHERLVRQWTGAGHSPMEVRLAGPVSDIRRLPAQTEIPFAEAGQSIAVKLSDGDYLVE